MGSTNTLDTDRLTALFEKSTLRANRIRDGKNTNQVFADTGEEVRSASLDKALTNLEYTIESDQFPEAMNAFTMPAMACIAHDPNSDYAKRNPNSVPKDTWWSHLGVQYQHEGHLVPHSIVAINGCYIDLIKRTKGRLLESYGKSCVNVYIPTDIYSEIHALVQQKCEFSSLAEGKEVSDPVQGLTSILVNKGTDEDKSIKLTIYTPVIDEDDKVVSYDRKGTTLEVAYKSAESKPVNAICGGVAFLRFGLHFGCTPGTYGDKVQLPSNILPALKAKIFGFHILTFDGEKVDQISYRRTAAPEY